MRDDFRLGGIPVSSNNAQQTEGQITSLLSGEIVSQIPFPVEAGSPHPLGATPSALGVNFSIASSNAAGVELFLFSTHDSPHPLRRHSMNWQSKCSPAAIKLHGGLDVFSAGQKTHKVGNL